MDRSQRGREGDPFYEGSYRVLVRFWGFTEWSGVVYCFVDYYAGSAVCSGDFDHSLFKKYSFLKDRAPGNRGPLVPPFYCVPASSVVAAAAAYPDPDVPFRPYNPQVDAEHVVVYHPSFVELCDPLGCDASKLPSTDLNPPVPEDLLPVAVDVEEEDLVVLTNEDS